MSIEQFKLKNIIEAAMFAVAHPMSVDQLLKLFDDDDRPSANAVKGVIKELQSDCDGRGIELKEIASGYRYQARQDFSSWLSRLWEERPGKYSRAALETLALIAYRQPVTRAEIEDVRGVGVSSSIIKTMIEREWIRVVGHRDVPGRPALYATTKQFLDYFNMKSLEELPTLAEIKDLEDINPELDLPNPDDERDTTKDISGEPEGDSKDQQNLLDTVDQSEELVKAEPSSEDVQDTSENIDESSPVEEAEDDEQSNIEEYIASSIEEDNQSDIESEPESSEISEVDTSEAYVDELDDIHSDSNKDSFYADPEELSDSDDQNNSN